MKGRERVDYALMILRFKAIKSIPRKLLLNSEYLYTELGNIAVLRMRLLSIIYIYGLCVERYYRYA